MIWSGAMAGLRFASTGAPLLETAAPPVLDGISATVAGAYGLRQMHAAYAGPAVRVRRDSDNDETDIGFTGPLLDTTALAAFCGASNGYGSVWYDQSGAGQNVVQPAPSQQPQIVAAGAVQPLGNATGRPALVFSGPFNQGLGCPTFAMGAGVSSFSAHIIARAAPVPYHDYGRLLGYAAPDVQDYQTPGSVVFADRQGDALVIERSQGAISAVHLSSIPFHLVSLFDGANGTLFSDGAAISGPGASTGDLSPVGVLGVGTGAGTQTWDGAIAEIIVIAGPLSAADQTAIRVSQRSFYGTP